MFSIVERNIYIFLTVDSQNNESNTRELEFMVSAAFIMLAFCFCGIVLYMHVVYCTL